MWARAFAAASMAWAIALPLAPFAASRPHGGGVLFGFAYSVYAVGSVICHQIPARSFHLWAAPMPVCARCTGIYLGAAVAAVVVARPFQVRASHPGIEGAATTGAATRRRVLLLAMIPTVATLLYGWTTGDTPANWIRALAGAPIGAAVAWIIREVN